MFTDRRTDARLIAISTEHFGPGIKMATFTEQIGNHPLRKTDGKCGGLQDSKTLFLEKRQVFMRTGAFINEFVWLEDGGFVSLE